MPTENAPARRQAAPPAVDQAAEAADALVRTVRSDTFMSQVADALPENVPARRFVRSTVTALLANPDLALCDHTKMLRAMLRSAADGLVPDGREAAIVLRKGEPVYTPMIGGYRKVAAEFGWSIDAHVVYSRDSFDYALGDEPRVDHRPSLGDRGEPTHAYAVGRHRDGRRVIEVMDLAEIEKRRKQATTDKVWSQWWDRMAEKTVGKAVFGRLPLDPADHRVRAMIDADELDTGDAARAVYGAPRASAGTAERVEQPRRELEQRREPPAQPAPETGTVTPPTDAGDPDHPGGAGDAARAESGDEPVVDVEQPPDAGPALEDARAIAFTSGPNEGKTLGQIADADGAVTYFTWALSNLERMPDELAAAIRVVAEHDVPDAWATHTGGGA